MFERFRAFQSLTREIRTARPAPLDESGRQLVKIHVSDDSNFLSPFSTDGLPMLSSETAEFLEHSIKHLRPDTPLHIDIEGQCIEAEERILYEKAIRIYYHAEFSETVRNIRKNTIQTVTMTFLAALTFALALILTNRAVQSVFLEMIDVVAWVFMWEAADIFFFQRSTLRMKRLRYFNLIQADISFS